MEKKLLLTPGPTPVPEDVLAAIPIKYEEAGHIAVTVLESLLEDLFEAGERFVAAAAQLYPPGVIGPFALQSIVTPGPPQKGIVVVDVSPRVPGSPGIGATPYSSYLHGRSVPVGERLAMELRKTPWPATASPTSSPDAGTGGEP